MCSASQESKEEALSLVSIAQKDNAETVLWRGGGIEVRICDVINGAS
jgi:hypothetical protein